MMRAVHIFVLCILSRASTLEIFIDSPVVLLDCRNPSQDGQFIDGSTAKFEVSEEPVENTTEIDATEGQGESTTKNQINEEPIDLKEFYDAASRGDLSFINTAISQLSSSGLDLNWCNTGVPYDGYTALHIAAEEDQPSIVAALLDAGADPDVQDSYIGRTPMYIAADYNHISVLRLLLDHKYQADVNLQDVIGETPVYTAARGGHNVALELLLAHGGDPNKLTNEGTSPLMIASFMGRVEAVRMLIQAGAHVNHVRPSDGYTALHWATRSNEADVARLLLENGADKNKQDNSGRTAAVWARDRGYDSVSQLIDNY